MGAAGDAITICARADEVIKVGEIEVANQRAINLAHNSEMAVSSAQKKKSEAILEVNKVRSKLKAFAKTKDKSSAALIEIKSLEAAVASAEKASKDASDVLKARKVAATERDALNDQLSASVSKITLLNEELAQVQKAIARTVEAKAVMSKQSGLLNEKTKIKTALEGLGNS